MNRHPPSEISFAPAIRHAWTDEFQRQVMANGQIRSYRAHTVILQEGEPAESLYWIIEGELVAYVEDEQGRVLELSRMGPGEYFGELLFANAQRTASVRTATPVRLCRIGRGTLEALLVAEPQLALEIIRMLSNRLAALTGKVRGIALSDVYSRLERFLGDNAVSSPEGGPPCVHGVSQQEMAERLGASKSMVNRLLKDLHEGGYIDIERRSIRLLRTLPKRW